MIDCQHPNLLTCFNCKKISTQQNEVNISWGLPSQEVCVCKKHRPVLFSNVNKFHAKNLKKAMLAIGIDDDFAAKKLGVLLRCLNHE